MPGTAVLMRQIHNLRRFLRDLQEQVERAPRQHKAQQAKVTRQEDAAKENLEAIKRLKMSVHEKEVTLKTTHGQIAKHQKQLNEAASKKEYDALQLEIANDRAACERLEDEILTAMGEIDERTAKVPELDQAARRAKEEFAEWEKGSEDRLASWKGQMAEAQGRLKEAEEQVPDRVRTQYDRVVKSKGADGFAAVHNRNCSACQGEITAQMSNELAGDHFVFCKSCGRILYLPEQAPVAEE
jgi:predicted  nucleic acid-binding Zn-ribbon protein